jgi:hypothetical protein
MDKYTGNRKRPRPTNTTVYTHVFKQRKPTSSAGVASPNPASAEELQDSSAARDSSTNQERVVEVKAIKTNRYINSVSGFHLHYPGDSFVYTILCRPGSANISLDSTPR